MTTPTAPAVADAARTLADELRGRIVLPDHDDYETARAVWNAMHDRRPAVIVQALGTADVIAALRFGREHDLRIAVRGGGHNVAGNGSVDGGLVIDLGPMHGVRVDPAARRVRVAPGVTLGGLDRETEPFGLVVPIGVISATGVAGLTLGGGVGWLTRSHGLTIDSLVSADVVTADGRLMRAAEDADADLLWGLRGGGGNFGIVTSFEFATHPLPGPVQAGTFIYEPEHWTEALRGAIDWSRDLPDAMTPIISFITPPAGWELGDRTLLFVGFVWADPDRAAGDRLVGRLRDAAPPDIESLEPARWIAWQSAADEIFPRGVRAYWKNASLDRIDDATIATIVDFGGRMPSARTGFDVHVMGGAVAAVPQDATAFPNRTAPYWVNMYATWDDPADDEAARAWARDFHAALSGVTGVGSYVNFLGAETTLPDGSAADPRAAAEAAYGPVTYARLVALKRRFDPDNVFRLNHNIPPD